MAGRQRTLTVEQEVAKAEAAEACAELREVRRIAHAEAKLAAELRIEGVQKEADRRLLRAYSVGVPKSQLRTHDVLGSTNPHTLDQALARAMGNGEDGSASTVFSWLDRAQGIVRVRYPNFPTTSIDTEDYPAMLSGTVQRTNEGVGWVVLEDASDQVTEFGNMPGWLRWEVERPLAGDRHIAGMLNAWAAENGGVS